MYVSGIWTNLLLAGNDFMLSAILVVGFSLLAYIATHNWRSQVARSFCLLLGSLIAVLAAEVLLRQARTAPTLAWLWRAQWLGIALAPATYAHFAMALLGATSSVSRWARGAVAAAYAASGGFWLLAVSGELLVRRDLLDRQIALFGAGPLMAVFVAYFLTVTGLGVLWIRQARQRALTPATRRRLSYLSASFMAPMLGAFPYLLIAITYDWLPLDLHLLLLGASNAGVGVMMTLMAYSVAYHGVIVPDRIIKYNFLRYVLYGPVVGVSVVVCLQIVDPLTALTGLPRETITMFGVMMMTVLMPSFIGRVRPTVDMLIYRQDRAEMSWLRDLERRSFTRSDLRQFLENTLVAVCGALRVESGFVAAPSEEGFLVQASCGPRREIKHFLAKWPLNDLLSELSHGPRSRSSAPDRERFVLRDGYCLLPLHDDEGAVLGAIGVACQPEQLTVPARRLIGALAHQMELALSHVQLQQGIFKSLRGLAPQMESLHQLTSELEQAAPEPASIALDVALHPEFPQLVKDALSHYWGGPKLSDSPLLGLRTVRLLLDEQGGGSPTRALQSVLRQAIDNIRPDGQLDQTAPEWMLYKILELRFLKGQRIREIIDKLAMSESDFYRKQRVAVEEVARQLALMEEQGGRL